MTIPITIAAILAIAGYVVGGFTRFTKWLGIPGIIFAFVIFSLALVISVLAFLLLRKQHTSSPSVPPVPQYPSDPPPIHDSAGFVGRTAEMTTVVAALLNHHSLLIHGEPGIGKTELAIQALRSPELQHAFNDRLFWFDRTPDSLAELCNDVARRINAQPVLQADDLEQKIAILRTSLGNSPPLLAFNNADGPAAAAVSAFCQRVVPAPLLATSRHPVPGMERIDPPPLQEQDALAVFAAYSRQPAAAELDPVKQVLLFLDYNPLAVILAAGIFKDMPAADLLPQLQSRPFVVLKDATRSMAIAIDLSYDRLTQPLQRLFAALGVFQGPDFSSEAVLSLFEEDMGLELGNLVGVSLLRRDQATSRYSLHPLLKQYAWEKVAVQDKDALHLRLAGYYTAFTSLHMGSAQEDIDALVADFPNIREVIQWGLPRCADKAVAPSLVASVVNLAPFLHVRGHWTEGITWGEAAVLGAKVLQDDRRLGQATHNLGVAYHRQGRLDEARDLYRQSLDVKRRSADQQGEARSRYQESLGIKKLLNDQRGSAATFHQLGTLAQEQHHLDEARGLYLQSLQITQHLGDQQGLATTLHQLGTLAQEQGRGEEAGGFYSQSLDIAKRLGHQQLIAQSFGQLGLLAQQQGRVGEARALTQQAVTVYKLLSDQLGIATSLGQLGTLDEEEGKLIEAQEQYTQALEILERLQSPDAAIARRSLQRVQEKLKASAP